MDFKKYGIVYLMVFVLVLVFIGTRLFPNLTLEQLIRSGDSTQSSVAPDSQLPQVSVTINFETEKKNYTDIAAKNPYEALLTAAAKDKLEVGTKQYDFGIFVEKIGSTASKEDRAWIYYVNGKSGDIAADKKELKTGDSVEWKYEKPL